MPNTKWPSFRVLVFMLLFGVAVDARAQQDKVLVSGRIFGSNGLPARGTLKVSWNDFTTETAGLIRAGHFTEALSNDGAISLRLIPNEGASPEDSAYTVTYHLGDGPESTKRWVVPSKATASIADVELELGDKSGRSVDAGVSLPSSDRAFSSPSIQYLPLSGGNLSGPVQLVGDPVAPMQPATKNYTDTAVATALPLAGGVVSGSLSAANLMAKLPRIDVRVLDFAGGADPTGARDSLPAISAAISFAQANATTREATYPTIYFPPGHYIVNGTIRLPNNMHMVGDSKANVILQEVNPSANLLTIYSAKTCSVYFCYGGIEGVTLEGSGKATAGSLLETDAGTLIFRDLQFYNNGGRGLQMNGPSERITATNLSFFDVRWPLVLSGDTNEDYFYNTHVVEAGQTKDSSGSPTWFSNWCYSVNCTNGIFNPPGTQTTPTILYPDPHGSIHIDKAVNIHFVGGSIKSTGVMSGVRIWNGDLVGFEHMYHEDSYGGNIPRTNRAYILGGKAEQTYFTGTLTATSLIVAVHDASWMPQYYGTPADVSASNGDYYPYVILPQDYNRASTAPSAYVPGLLQDQFEVVNIGGFASDGNLYIANGGRNLQGSTAPQGTQWTAGSVIEQFSGMYGFEGSVDFNDIHLNQVQGPTAVGGYQVGCNQTNAWACGEMMVGFAPDIQAPTSNPATNQVGLYAPLGDPNDPVPAAEVSLSLKGMSMGYDQNNPYVGQIATHHLATIQVFGRANAEGVESTAAVLGTAAGKQMSISAATGGSYVTAPLYATGAIANVQVTMPNSGTTWDSFRGVFTKNNSVFGRYQQFGAYMSGLQYQNQYCLFDTPTVDGGHVANRFCAGGGPSNTTPGGAGYGPGIEYDSWNGNAWVSLFKVSAVNGAGSVTTGPLTSTSVVSGGSVTAAKVLFSGNGSSLSNTPTMVWSPWGACSSQYAGCNESGAPLNLMSPVTIQGWTMTLMSIPTGCTNAGTVTLYNGSNAIGLVNLVNGTSIYTAPITSLSLPANSALSIKISAAATGCSVFGAGFNNNVTYTMQ